jgi:site-specific DNA-methyltransferase (adenine-specific)
MTDFRLSQMSDDHWATPPLFYEKLNAEFNFNDDPCPLHGEKTANGLKREWGTRTFMNPPYSNIKPWVKKAYEESLKGKLVVGLLRGDTSTAWFHTWILGKAKIRFIQGRLKFGVINKAAPFPSIVAIWDGRHTMDMVSPRMSDAVKPAPPAKGE